MTSNTANRSISVTKSTAKGSRSDRFFLILRTIFCCLPWLTACSDKPNLPEPPLSFPFDTQTAGFKIGTDVRIVEHNSYEFGFQLGFKEGDTADRERVKNLVGDPWRDKEGKLIKPGIPITVKIRIHALKPSSLEVPFERQISEVSLNAWGDSYFRTEITKVRLKPGRYHFQIENLKVIPELKNTPVTLAVTTDPKSTSISD